jgi:hypothetical protein
MLALRYFAMVCNNAEYKNMGQVDLSLGQLYNVQNKIKIYAKHIYYDKGGLK